MGRALFCNRVEDAYLVQTIYRYTDRPVIVRLRVLSTISIAVWRNRERVDCGGSPIHLDIVSTVKEVDITLRIPGAWKTRWWSLFKIEVVAHNQTAGGAET